MAAQQTLIRADLSALEVVADPEALETLKNLCANKERAARDIQTMRFIIERDLQATDIAKDKEELDKEVKEIVADQIVHIQEQEKKAKAQAEIDAKKEAARLEENRKQIEAEKKQESHAPVIKK